MKTISRISAITALILATGAAGMASADRGGQFGRGPGMQIDFAAVDANSDGLLDKTELTARATERLAEADTNADGNLDREELKASVPERGGRIGNLFGADRSERMADRILAMHGATEAGQVAIADMAAQRVNMMLANLDQDRDSAISQEEAENMAQRFRGGRGDRDEQRRGDAGQRSAVRTL